MSPTHPPCHHTGKRWDIGGTFRSEIWGFHQPEGKSTFQEGACPLEMPPAPPFPSHSNSHILPTFPIPISPYSHVPAVSLLWCPLIPTYPGFLPFHTPTPTRTSPDSPPFPHPPITSPHSRITPIPMSPRFPSIPTSHSMSPIHASPSSRVPLIPYAPVPMSLWHVPAQHYPVAAWWTAHCTPIHLNQGLKQK